MRSLHAIWPFWAALAAGLVWEDGTGKLPAMGWNSWDTYECNISATLFVTQAQAMLDLGLLVRLPTACSRRRLTPTLRNRDTNT